VRNDILNIGLGLAVDSTVVLGYAILFRLRKAGDWCGKVVVGTDGGVLVLGSAQNQTRTSIQPPSQLAHTEQVGNGRGNSTVQIRRGSTRIEYVTSPPVLTFSDESAFRQVGEEYNFTEVGERARWALSRMAMRRQQLEERIRHVEAVMEASKHVGRVKVLVDPWQRQRQWRESNNLVPPVAIALPGLHLAIPEQ
jgi:hypothetical protein